MQIYVKGYYGYQNRGDELLLLGVLQFLYKNYTDFLQKSAFQKILFKMFGNTSSQDVSIYVESGDIVWLEDWISRNKELLGPVSSSIKVVSKRNLLQFAPWVLKVIGGGEVITDARSFPHNGRNYFFLYWLSLLFGKVMFLGGIGEPKSRHSKILRYILLKYAKQVIVREQTSFERVLKYTQKVSLHRDFAYDVLANSQQLIVHSQKPYIIINCNSHLWNKEVKEKVEDFCRKHSDCVPYYSKFQGNLLSSKLQNHHQEQGPQTQNSSLSTCNLLYFPAAMGDDSDVPYYEILKQTFPNMKLYDWRNKSIEETLSFFSHATTGIATRLHVLLPLQYYNIPVEALVYQEKVSKILGFRTSGN